MTIVTKFNPGDEVWTVCENKVHRFRIARIELSIRSIRTSATCVSTSSLIESYIEERQLYGKHSPVSVRHDSRECFPTKESLLKKLAEG